MSNAVKVRVVFLFISLLLWLVATFVRRHYVKRRGVSATVPGGQPAASPWWVRIGDVSYPVANTATLRAWARDRRFGRDDLVWEPGASRWIAASDLTELRSEFYPPFVVRWKYDLFLRLWPLYFVLLAIAGVVMISASFQLGLLSALSALRWQTASGRITRSAVSEKDIGPSGYSVLRYCPAIEYQYRVSNRSYAATRRDFAQRPEDDGYEYRAQAEAIAAAFPLNGRVTVYFDPKQPARATLDRCQWTIVVFVMGALMVTSALVVLRSWWRQRGRRVAQMNFPSESLE